MINNRKACQPIIYTCFNLFSGLTESLIHTSHCTIPTILIRIAFLHRSYSSELHFYIDQNCISISIRIAFLPLLYVEQKYFPINYHHIERILFFNSSSSCGSLIISRFIYISATTFSPHPLLRFILRAVSVCFAASCSFWHRSNASSYRCPLFSGGWLFTATSVTPM